MAAVKDEISTTLAARLADELTAAWPAFPRRRFTRGLTDALAPLALIARVEHLTDRVVDTLPGDRAAWVVRHGLRSLIKNGDPAALDLLGITPDADIRLTTLTVDQGTVAIGQAVTFTLTLELTGRPHGRDDRLPGPARRARLTQPTQRPGRRLGRRTRRPSFIRADLRRVTRDSLLLPGPSPLSPSRSHPLFTLATLTLATNPRPRRRRDKSLRYPRLRAAGTWWLTEPASWPLSALPAYWVLRTWQNPAPVPVAAGLTCACLWLAALARRATRHI